MAEVGVSQNFRLLKKSPSNCLMQVWVLEFFLSKVELLISPPHPTQQVFVNTSKRNGDVCIYQEVTHRGEFLSKF